MAAILDSPETKDNTDTCLMGTESFFVFFILVWVSCLLACKDFLDRRLPNSLVIIYALLFVAAWILTGHGFDVLTSHMATGGVTLVFGMALVALGGMGGGDAKLAAAVMLWSGPDEAMTTLLLITQTGLILALSGLAARRLGRQAAPATVWHRFLYGLDANRGVPYGIALATGGVYACWQVLSGTP
ncbi:prepilin peptidase [Laribacter hongkongensis]|nr:prepilin peptidase [Laribacter hongkongensis]MCG9052509.1 prepilin peptidase [Laribacter hongkongensis]MCG9063757.1 prepilin peptidase [Laribacter hongkongensis]